MKKLAFPILLLLMIAIGVLIFWLLVGDGGWR